MFFKKANLKIVTSMAFQIEQVINSQECYAFAADYKRFQHAQKSRCQHLAGPKILGTLAGYKF